MPSRPTTQYIFLEWLSLLLGSPNFLFKVTLVRCRTLLATFQWRLSVSFFLASLCMKKMLHFIREHSLVPTVTRVTVCCSCPLLPPPHCTDLGEPCTILSNCKLHFSSNLVLPILHDIFFQYKPTKQGLWWKQLKNKFSLFSSSAERSCPNLVSVMAKAATDTPGPLLFPQESNKQQSKCKSLQSSQPKGIHLIWATLLSGVPFSQTSNDIICINNPI